MPEIETQVYWHEIPASQPLAPPWGVSVATQQQLINKSRQIRHLRISPPDCMLHTTSCQRRNQRKTAASGKVDKGIIAEPDMTSFAVVNLLFAHLGKAQVTEAEVKETVHSIAEEIFRSEEQVEAAFTQSQREQQRGNTGGPQSNMMMPMGEVIGGSNVHGSVAPADTAKANEVHEAPLLSVLEILCEKRKLKVHTLHKKDIQLKRHQITPQDLIFGQKVALIIDRQRPMLAACILDRKTNDKTLKETLHLLVPVAEPTPWRRRAFGVHSIDRFECLVSFVYVAELDDELNGEDCDNAGNGDGGTSDVSSVASSQRSAELNPNAAEGIAPGDPLLPTVGDRLQELLEDEELEMPAPRNRKRRRNNDASDDDDGGVSALPDPHQQHGRIFSSAGLFELSEDPASYQPLSAFRRRVCPADRAAMPFEILRNANLCAESLSRLQHSSQAFSQADGESAVELEDVPVVKKALVHKKVEFWLDPLGMSTSLHSTLSPQQGGEQAVLLGGEAAPDADGEVTVKTDNNIVIARTSSTVGTLSFSFPRREVPFQDPFMELPTVAVPDARQTRINVRHTWAQRLIERQRRDRLYAVQQ